MEEDKYLKCKFGATAHLINPTETEINETVAANKKLAALLPEGVDPENDPDLLYIAADLAVAGMINANDDCLLPEDAVKVYKSFEKKQCNIEHNRGDVCGYILKAYLTDRESGDILTEDEALALGKPFNISTVAVVWKVVNKQLCDFIISASDPTSPDYKKLSLSFEMGFTSFSIVSSSNAIAIGSEIIKTEDEKFEELKSHLRVLGGAGVYDGKKISRALAGRIVPLGQGIVGNPAAQVKGIEAVLEKPETEKEEENEIEEDDSLEMDLDIEDAKLHKFLTQRLLEYIGESKINDKNDKKGVSHNIEFLKTMQIKDLKQLEEKWNELVKSDEALASVRALFADEIAKESEKYVKELEAEKQKLVDANAEKDRLTQAQADLTKQLDDVKKELDGIKAAQAAAEAEQKFNNRMAYINDEFLLSDEEKALVTEEVRSLDDEAFAKWQKKAAVMMREKTKAFKAKKKKDMEDSMTKAGVKVEIDEETLDFKEVIASAKEQDTQIPNTLVLSGDNLKDIVKKAFAKENIGLGKK